MHIIFKISYMPLRTAGYLKARSWENEPSGPR